ncbi:hypothetical protein SISSUDRAFT_1032078 [Sistotremastrum suecicum HHB10207 ss-3]|uniref:Chitin-binding type-4 domain-containing protein n=1 Tax=Sistotremastrum suecicum HHB10207 ss-3 TaxID=1314776 RepID=A0A166F441_9AGAM|nr:hypothetical protein SISSUDRAFT_1032078 [Sistotremastrum suecicum HHB10207 ss-3]
MSSTLRSLFIATALFTTVLGHASIWNPAMWGWNITGANNAADPLRDLPFDQWWFHGHLGSPPHPEDVVELPAGGKWTAEIACNKAFTSYWPENNGTAGDYPCPGAPTKEFHANNLADVQGCGLAIAYTPPSHVNDIKPEDFVIFSVNHTCVWTLHTDFHVPAKMPACPEGGCTCAWFWEHASDSGTEQIYMTGFQCNVTGATSDVPVAKPNLARRCGNDPQYKEVADPQNCTYGAKQPFYWLQQEGNNMFENSFMPPVYNQIYGFEDGSQDDIFVDSPLSSMTWAGAPTPGMLTPVTFFGFTAAETTAWPKATGTVDATVSVTPAATATPTTSSIPGATYVTVHSTAVSYITVTSASPTSTATATSSSMTTKASSMPSESSSLSSSSSSTSTSTPESAEQTGSHRTGPEPDLIISSTMISLDDITVSLPGASSTPSTTSSESVHVTTVATVLSTSTSFVFVNNVALGSSKTGYSYTPSSRPTPNLVYMGSSSSSSSSADCTMMGSSSSSAATATPAPNFAAASSSSSSSSTEGEADATTSYITVQVTITEGAPSSTATSSPSGDVVYATTTQTVTVIEGGPSTTSSAEVESATGTDSSSISSSSSATASSASGTPSVIVTPVASGNNTSHVNGTHW